MQANGWPEAFRRTSQPVPSFHLQAFVPLCQHKSYEMGLYVNFAKRSWP